MSIKNTITNRFKAFKKSLQHFEGFGTKFTREAPLNAIVVDRGLSAARGVETFDDRDNKVNDFNFVADRLKTQALVGNRRNDAVRLEAAKDIMLQEANGFMGFMPVSRSRAADILREKRQGIVLSEAVVVKAR